MKKINLLGLLFFLLQSSLSADECSKSYVYIDRHKVTTTMDGKPINEEANMNARLHVRSFDENGTNYKIFWLEDGKLDKEEIDIHSIYAPFLIQNGKEEDEFVIKNIKSLAKDGMLEKQLLGLVDVLQFKSSDGVYNFLNRNGTVDINQTTHKGSTQLQSLLQYSAGVVNPDIHYLSSDENMTFSKSKECLLWDEVNLVEKIDVNIPLMKSTMSDDRVFKFIKSAKTLSSSHWFNDLSADLSTWGFNKKVKTYSLQDALNDFDKKENEMKDLLKDSKAFEEWVRNNMDFLAHLNDMLLSKKLDDGVSKKLFANLGYIDTQDSANILSQVTLNVDILEKERFRSLMALENTSAPLDEELLDDLLLYGLSSQNGGDFIKDATGMLVGTLAKNRVDRSPAQLEKISNAIINAIGTQADKTVSLSAAGNMLQSAPDSVVDTVDDMLLSTGDSKTRSYSADALSRIERSSLNTENFQNLFENETQSNTISKLILASSSAKNFKSNNDFKEVLVNISKNHSEIDSIRLASLETLEKAHFGKTNNEKKLIRGMMFKEKDKEISKKLKELYRQ